MRLGLESLFICSLALPFFLLQPSSATSRTNNATNQGLPARDSFQRLRHLVRAELEELGLEQEKRSGTKRPPVTILVSNGRSGSNFLAQVLNAHPGTFYHLVGHYTKQVCGRGSLDEEEVMDILEHLLTCNFTHPKMWADARVRSRTLKRYETDNGLTHLPTPLTPSSLRRICALHPFQLAKINSFDLSLLQRFLNHSRLEARLVYLVRDPRAVMHSRHNDNWNAAPSACRSVHRLCPQIQRNFLAAQHFRRRFPRQFMAVRFEDLALNLRPVLQQLFRFLQFGFTRRVHQFLDTHTRQSSGDNHSTKRNTTEVPLAWTRNWHSARLQHDQRKCRRAMRLWGYKPLPPTSSPPQWSNSTSVQSRVLAPPPWPNMPV